MLPFSVSHFSIRPLALQLSRLSKVDLVFSISSRFIRHEMCAFGRSTGDTFCNHQFGVTNSQTELQKVFNTDCNLLEVYTLRTLSVADAGK